MPVAVPSSKEMSVPAMSGTRFVFSILTPQLTALVLPRTRLLMNTRPVTCRTSPETHGTSCTRLFQLQPDQLPDMRADHVPSYARTEDAAIVRLSAPGYQ